MAAQVAPLASATEGIRLGRVVPGVRSAFLERIAQLGLLDCVRYRSGRHSLDVWLDDRLARQWTPDSETLNLAARLQLDPAGSAEDLEREIVLALLAAPRRIEFPSEAELAAAIRIRINIVRAAEKTQLAFDTQAAERPVDYWTYDEERGFTLLPGQPLIAALEKATQPDASGKLFSFSCYRATEYVTLLAIAQELERTHPALLTRLQRQWETRAIKSAEFHEVFLAEYGSFDDPLPSGYFVPGDRLWFRNPDERSAAIEGYEGSWVFYLGGGLFSNFWKRAQPYTMTSKCVEIFHWRHGAQSGGAGELTMNEAVVDTLAAESLRDRRRSDAILDRMYRLRDPRDVYADGGCLDASREAPRWVCPGTAAIELPDA